MNTDKYSYKLGFDIGGTFTDFILLNENTGCIYSYKLLTTPKDPSIAVIEGIKYLIDESVSYTHLTLPTILLV